MVVTCGSCMRTRREVLVRLDRIKEAGVAVVNYGVPLAWPTASCRARSRYCPVQAARAGRGRRRVLRRRSARPRRSAEADQSRPRVLGILALSAGRVGLRLDDAYLLPRRCASREPSSWLPGTGAPPPCRAPGARVALGFSLAVALAFPAAVLVSFAPVSAPPSIPLLTFFESPTPRLVPSSSYGSGSASRRSSPSSSFRPSSRSSSERSPASGTSIPVSSRSRGA